MPRLVGWKREITFEWRFCFFRLSSCAVGLPASAGAAYEPFHVARLLAGLVLLGREIVRCRNVLEG